MQSCRVCGRLILRLKRSGRVADYCSVRCRRRLEKWRKSWDTRASLCADPGGYYAGNRDMPDRSPEQRAYWQQQLEQARAELIPIALQPLWKVPYQVSGFRGKALPVLFIRPIGAD
jgi:hypothetical protein